MPACCFISSASPWRASSRLSMMDAVPLPTIDLNASPQLHSVCPSTTSQSVAISNATGSALPAALTASILRPVAEPWKYKVRWLDSASNTYPKFNGTMVMPSASVYARLTILHVAIIASTCCGSATSRSARLIMRCLPATVCSLLRRVISIAFNSKRSRSSANASPTRSSKPYT